VSIPADKTTRTVEVTLHSGYIPPLERTECLVRLGITGEWLVAIWVPEVERWRFPYEEPVSEVRNTQIVTWMDLGDLWRT
jgi:hypothetical protein